MKVTLEMTEDGFEHLSNTSTKWAGQDWEAQADRFNYLTKEDFKFKYAYWTDSYSNTLLMQAFLKEIGAPFKVLLDEVFDDPYVIITNYASLCWQKDEVKA